MVNVGFTESVVEDAAHVWLAALDYAVLHCPEVDAGVPDSARVPKETQ